MSSNDNLYQSLQLETKALIIVNEFEARQMPMYQLRQIFHDIAVDAEEVRAIIDLVSNDLHAGGYDEQDVNNFLTQLIRPPEDTGQLNKITRTRRLRSPFAHGFEGGNVAPVAPLPGAPEYPESFNLPPVGAAPQQRHKTERSVQPGLPVAAPQASIPAAPALPPQPAPPPVAPQPASPQQPQGLPQFQGQTRIIPRPSTSSKPFVGDRPSAQRMAGMAKNAPVQFGASRPGIAINMPVPATRPVILVADDDKRIRMVQKIRLEDAGFTVLEAGDGTEAWRIIREGGISLAVLDMKMPGLHGLEVLSRIVDAAMNLPIIISSAYDQLKDEFIVATYPNLKYLIKPVAPDKLLAAVQELIGPQA